MNYRAWYVAAIGCEVMYGWVLFFYSPILHWAVNFGIGVLVGFIFALTWTIGTLKDPGSKRWRLYDVKENELA